MNLKKTINEDFIASYKAKESEKVSVLRMLQSAIKNAEIDLKKDLDDAQVAEIITKQAKQRKDAIDQYQKGGRTDLVEKEQKELDIISIYMPKQLSEEEVVSVVKKAIQDTGAQNKSDMGKVMGAIMPQVKGKADGSLVSRIVSNELQ